MSYKGKRFLILGISFLFLHVPLQAEECVAWSSSLLNSKSLVVGEINVNTNNIFNLEDKSERSKLHRLANKIHINTRQSVIQTQLLFKTGEKFNLKKLEESERNIRKQKYIKSVSVTPSDVCGNRVNVRIETWDNWTLTPGFTFSRSGGNNRSGVEIQEHNLFGYGKSLSFSYKKGVERNSRFFYYRDPQFLGTRKKFAINLQDNTDGKGHAVELALPFYESSSKRSWGVNTSKLQLENSLYQAGDITDKISKEVTKHNVYYGWSKGEVEGSVSRFRVGWAFDKTDYLSSINKLLLPEDSTQESYPWVELQTFRDKYISKTNFRKMGKIEDISLGRSVTIGAGLLSKSLGSDDNHLKLSTIYSNGYELGGNNLGFIKLKGSSYLGNGSRKGESFTFSAEVDHFNKVENDYKVLTKISFSNNLKFGEQLSLGGETGLRGYPKSFQTGNKSFLVQAEKRIHFDWYPMHLVKFGAVLFGDVGTAWGDGNKPKLLADVGFGLRIVPTRSSTGKSLHLDVAFPLIDKGKVDKVQFLIRTSESF